MKYISHRGNLNGPNPVRENAPDYIGEAIAAGFEVEMDLRMVGGHLYLGHDYPQYRVATSWIDHWQDKLLLHIKDTASLNYVMMNRSKWHYFCHEHDRFTFTSQECVWLHDLSLQASLTTIVPLISRELLASYKNREVYAICSDYVMG